MKSRCTRWVACRMPRSPKFVSFCISSVSNTAPARTRRHGKFHRRLLGVLPRPLADDLVDFDTVFDARIPRLISLVVDQVLAPDKLQEARPMFGVHAAAGDVDVVVEPAAFCEDRDGRVSCCRQRSVI